MPVITNEGGCHIALTIERQLKSYSECTNHTERHEILWHEWNHNKRWLEKILQLILTSFPTYSMHDASHSETVLHNIEMLLGEENIARLSATDCFVILHTVYIHDIGMCITHGDRKKLIKNERFIQYLEQLRDKEDGELSYFASILLQECFKSINGLEIEKKTALLGKKLDVYYAITYLFAEYRRREHGDVSRERLINWIDTPDKLGAGFSTIEIPNRLFYIMANCANTHTKDDFKTVLDLNQEDTGYAHDYVHPRFVAILLQLGDALDMDSNRFHPLIDEFMGNIPRMSQLHQKKHKAIRRLRITNEKISISADCEDQEVLRQVRRECDGIRDILEKASYYWSVIRPKESDVGLPTLDKMELLLRGNPIPSELVETKFMISQEKAFNLLKGNNIYKEENFVFLRELLQNAVDATKIQYFRDCKMQLQRLHLDSLMEPNDAKKLIPPEQYPIEIELSIARSKNGETEILPAGKLEEIEKNLDGYECGVLVSIRDYGIGIGEEDIKKIADVGTSYENRKKEISKMPLWLQPTGTFGIGLQSVFLAGKELTAETHSHKEQPYKITFYPLGGTESGYINVTPLAEKEEMAYGTCFQMFVPNRKKKLHVENPETWDGIDPFAKDYDRRRPIRHSIELMKQMALYLAELVGEPLFPITIRLNTECVEKERRQIFFNSHFKNFFRNAGLALYFNDDELDKFAANGKTSWIYHIDDNENRDGIWQDNTGEGDICKLDCEKARLYIWNHTHNAYACIGIKRILSMREQLNNMDDSNPTKGVDIFYKGIKVTERFFKKDCNLIEYIDLKKTLDNSLLKLNRRGFSQEGDKYLEEVYESILITSRKALQYFGGHGRASKFELQGKILESIKELLELENVKISTEKNKEEAKYQEKSFVQQDKEQEQEQESVQEKTKEQEQKPVQMENSEQSQEGHQEDEQESRQKQDTLSHEGTGKAEEVILSAASLVYFAMLDETDDLFGNYNKNDNKVWQELLSELIKMLNRGYCFKDSTMYHIHLYTINKNETNPTQSEVSVLDIVDSNRKYAVISLRDKKSQFWRECLVEISEIHPEIKFYITNLRSSSDLKGRKKIMSELKHIAEPFLAANYLDENMEIGRARKEGAILKWILNNVPTMAIFSTPDGNVRMNVLDMEVCNSVYYDENMRMLTIERIKEEYKKRQIARYSTIVWSGYRYLGMAETRASILPVRRGKLCSIGVCELVFPLTGQELEGLFSEIENIMTKLREETSQIYANVIQPILAHIEKTVQNHYSFAVNDDSSTFWTKLEDMLNTSDEKKEIENKDLRCAKLSEEDCKKIVNELHEIGGESINSLVFPSIVRLAKIWEERVGSLNMKYINQKYCTTEAFKNLVTYTMENAKMKPSRRQVEILYSNYICEVQDAIQLREERAILKNFSPNFSNSLIDRVRDRQ